MIFLCHAPSPSWFFLLFGWFCGGFFVVCLGFFTTSVSFEGQCKNPKSVLIYCPISATYFWHEAILNRLILLRLLRRMSYKQTEKWPLTSDLIFTTNSFICIITSSYD